ncbi:hypothetical protein ILYODFUR_019373 [Ilyodon furcidens]|uniref:Uncharacterized protein n=1 Tax=Ilyodon furcidens TaxID=33524 RepID=A0ABV0U028_9TELE
MNWIFLFSIPKMFFSPHSLNSQDSCRVNLLVVSAAVNCFIPVRQEAGLFKPRKDVCVHGDATLSLFVNPSPPLQECGSVRMTGTLPHIPELFAGCPVLCLFATPNLHPHNSHSAWRSLSDSTFNL